MSADAVQPPADASSNSLEEDLVAYLDGELDDEASRRIEQLLSRDAQVRMKLQHLERTWHLLDHLDRAEPEEAFTRTTLEMVAVAAEEDLVETRAALPRRRRRRWLVGGASLLVAAAAGFLLVATVRPNPNRQLLEDLPILENLDPYRQVEELAFLRLLAREGLFAPADAPAVAAASRPLDDLFAERRERLEQMTRADKERLLRAQSRFSALPLAEQSQLRQLNRELAAASDSDRLQSVMRAYYDWLLVLAPYQRLELNELSAEKRVERVKRLMQDPKVHARRQQKKKEPPRIDTVKRAVQEQARRLGKWLDPKDVEGLFAWSAEMTDRHGQQLLAQLPSGRRRGIEQQISNVRDPQRRRQIFGWLWLQWQASNPDKPFPLSDDDLGQLRGRLSPATRQKLESKTPQEQWRIVAEWIALLQQERPYLRNPDQLISQETEEELALFFEHVLSQEEQDRLLTLPGDQMLRELWREYAQSKISKAPGRGGEAGRRNPLAKAPKTGKAAATQPFAPNPPSKVAPPKGPKKDRTMPEA